MVSGGLRVLLVEDSRILSDRVMELITELPGVDAIGIATTESEAVETIVRQQPDAVLLDLRLREGTGFGVMRRLKALNQRPVVVVMTNYNLPQYRREAEALGVKYFVDKTQDFEQIPVILQGLLRGRAER
ncbi:MAG: response regulator [Steroidobacteraceae bacterium]